MTEQEIRDHVGSRVCSGCGGKIEVRAVDAGTRFEHINPICPSCQTIMWGVPQSLFQFARFMVEHGRWIKYDGNIRGFLNKCKDGTPAERDYWLIEQTRIAVERYENAIQAIEYYQKWKETGSIN